jgi:hypothetical protein
MSQAIHIPDELYERLREYARRQASTPDDVVADWIARLGMPAAAENGHTEPQAATQAVPDPLAPFIGTFRFGVGDLAEKHDEYLAEAHADECKPEQ